MSNHANRGVIYQGKRARVKVEAIPFPELAIGKRRCDHGVILKVVTTNICGRINTWYEAERPLKKA